MIHIAIACLAATTTCVDDPLDDFDWVVVGEPGNRAANEEEAPQFFPPWWVPGLRLGAVDYPYRIMRTEVTVEQYFEFVNAYWPYFDGHVWDSELTGSFIFPLNPDPGPGEDPEYIVVSPHFWDVAANMSWRSAARYCNWLHNGKVSEAWAFESGVYDTSTWGFDRDGNPTDQVGHSPGARVWIATADEWIKASYYDPDRYGAGKGGYWLYPDGGDGALQPGWWWEDGAETNAGVDFIVDNPSRYAPVGMYPHVTSPWGLLDVSGCDSEWLEDLFSNGYRGRKGSWQAVDPYSWDRLDDLLTVSPDSTASSVRLVAPVRPCISDVDDDGESNLIDLITILDDQGSR